MKLNEKTSFRKGILTQSQNNQTLKTRKIRNPKKRTKEKISHWKQKKKNHQYRHTSVTAATFLNSNNRNT